MQTLRDLLEQAKTRHGGASGRALAELAAKHDHKIDRTQVNAILNGTYKSRPTNSLVRAVAWLAGVDEETAFEAADLPLPGPPFADELPPDVDQLTAQQRYAVITVIRAMLHAGDRMLKEPHHGDEAVQGTSLVPGVVTLNASRVLSAAEDVLTGPDGPAPGKLFRLLKAARDEAAHGRIDVAFMDSVLLEAAALELARAESAEERRRVLKGAEAVGVQELAKAARDLGQPTETQQLYKVLAAVGEESQVNEDDDGMEPS